MGKRYSQTRIMNILKEEVLLLQITHCCPHGLCAVGEFQTIQGLGVELLLRDNEEMMCSKQVQIQISILSGLLQWS